jgi:hypothetical protein
MLQIPKSIFWMARGLEQSLNQGITRWAEDTIARSQWLTQDAEAWHVIAGTMLVGCYSYAEGKLGKKWWSSMRSTSAKRDLELHWIVRNAFVHRDSIPKNLKSINATEIAELMTYCTNLKDGKILDDKGNVYPCHMEFQCDRIVLNREAISLIARLFETVYRSFK